MKTLFYSFVSIAWLLTACHDAKTSTDNTAATTTDSGSTSNWKLGSALWTFHNFNFPTHCQKLTVED